MVTPRASRVAGRPSESIRPAVIAMPRSSVAAPRSSGRGDHRVARRRVTGQFGAEVAGQSPEFGHMPLQHPATRSAQTDPRPRSPGAPPLFAQCHTTGLVQGLEVLGQHRVRNTEKVAQGA